MPLPGGVDSAHRTPSAGGETRDGIMLGKIPPQVTGTPICHDDPISFLVDIHRCLFSFVDVHLCFKMFQYVNFRQQR